MWILISSTKVKLLRFWLGGALLLLLLTFVQTLTGRLEGMVGLAWLWAAVNVLPGLGTLLAVALTDRRLSKLLPGFAHKTMIAMTLIYLLFVLISFLAEGLATQKELSMIMYRRNSFLWLAPFQLLLLLAYYLVFFRKKQLFQPDGSAVAAAAEKEAEKWMQKGDDLRAKFCRMLASGKTGEVLQQLYERSEQKENPDVSEVVILQNQYHQNHKDRCMNLISPQEAQRTNNRITVALMDLVKVI